MAGYSQQGEGLAGLGLIAAYNDQIQGGGGGSIGSRCVNSNANSNSNNQAPALSESAESIKREPMSPELPDVFDWGNATAETEGPTPGGYSYPYPQEQMDFKTPPPPSPSIPVPEQVPTLQDDFIKQNEYLTDQLFEVCDVKENLTEKVDKLEKTLGKKDEALRKKDEELMKKEEALRKKDEELKELQNEKAEKASLKKKLKRAEMDYYDEKKARKKMRDDLDDARKMLQELDEEVQRRKDMEDNLATVAFSLQELESAVRYAIGPGASLSNDVKQLGLQLKGRLNELSMSHAVVERNYLKAKEEVLGYQRMYGDMSQSQQLRDPRMQAPHQRHSPPLPTLSSNSLSSALVPTPPPPLPPTQYAPPPPPPPPEELDLEYDPRKTAVVPTKRPLDSISIISNGAVPRPSTSTAAAGFQQPMPPQSQSFAESPLARLLLAATSGRPNGVNENGQSYPTQDHRAASGSGLGHQQHAHFQGRSTTPTSSSSSSSMSCGEPTPEPSSKLEVAKKKRAKVEEDSDSDDEKEHGWKPCKSSSYFLCLCGEGFRKKEELFSHIQKRLTEKKFDCHVCDKKFSEKENLQSHILNTHGMNKLLVKLGPLMCHDCGGEFEDRSELFSHLKLVHQKGPHAPKVKQEFNAWRPRKRTLCSAHFHTAIIYPVDGPKVPRFACKCGKDFASMNTLNTHIKANAMGHIFQCKWCPKAFKMIGSLKTHMEKDHQIQRDKESCGCRDCGRVFRNYEKLMKHRTRKHSSTSNNE